MKRASTITSSTSSENHEIKNGIAKSKSSLDQKTHRSVYVVFISLLIDLLAFTIILPLLPSLLDYYHEHDKTGLYPFMLDKIKHFQKLVGAPDQFHSVLFGGLIGSMFSFLQFLASPMIGALSDIYGRKRVILLSNLGEAFSYALWAVSSNFTVFVIARIVGGISKGNISISTAIVTDVSSPKTRGRGMALIGVAFSLGFILGPITGALFAKWAKFQTGPFYTVPALLALSLSIMDTLFLMVFFKETLPKELRSKSLGTGLSKAANYINPIALFGFRPVQKVSKQDLKRMQQLGLIYFLYLFLYSGLEYTLTFLTHLRFEYNSIQQGKMFLFIGVIMAIIQGGYVRRIPPGNEKKTALRGIMLIIPSFIIVGFAPNEPILYVGLALYSFASATVVPCLITLVSTYGSHNQKGTVLGIFRSLGALARASGPIVASIVYWSLGSSTCYVIGGILLSMPLFLLKRIQL